jgi:hypothetical protein
VHVGIASPRGDVRRGTSDELMSTAESVLHIVADGSESSERCRPAVQLTLRVRVLERVFSPREVSDDGAIEAHTACIRFIGARSTGERDSFHLLARRAVIWGLQKRVRACWLCFRRRSSSPRRSPHQRVCPRNQQRTWRFSRVWYRLARCSIH